MHLAKQMRFPFSILVGIGILAITGTASANPVLVGSIYTHVQEVNPNFCEENPFTTFEDISPNTPLTGELEFDLFYSCMDVVDSVSVTLEWPAEWSFVSFEFCDGGGNATALSHGLALIVDTPGGASLLGLFGRLVLNASTAGELDLIDPRIHLPGWGWETVYGVGARTGLLCGDCPPDPWQHPNFCVPELTPTSLELTAEQGASASDEFEALLNDLIGCTATFDSEADWITLEVDQPLPYIPHYIVTVTADAIALEIGVHQSWVYVDSGDCIECLEVIFEVTEDSPVESATWGQIKSVFR